MRQCFHKQDGTLALVRRVGPPVCPRAVESHCGVWRARRIAGPGKMRLAAAFSLVFACQRQSRCCYAPCPSVPGTAKKGPWTPQRNPKGPVSSAPPGTPGRDREQGGVSCSSRSPSPCASSPEALCPQPWPPGRYLPARRGCSPARLTAGPFPV